MQCTSRSPVRPVRRMVSPPRVPWDDRNTIASSPLVAKSRGRVGSPTRTPTAPLTRPPPRRMTTAETPQSSREWASRNSISMTPQVPAETAGTPGHPSCSPIGTRVGAKNSSERALASDFPTNFASPIAAKVALDFARAMEKASGSKNGGEIGYRRSQTPPRCCSHSRGSSSPTASTRLSSAATQLSSTEPPLSRLSSRAGTQRLSSAGTQQSSNEPAQFHDDDVMGCPKPRKLYPEVFVQTKESVPDTPPPVKVEGSTIVEAAAASVPDESTVPSHVMLSATTIIREQAESIEKSRGQLQTQMNRIDNLLQEIVSARELQAPLQCTPMDVQSLYRHSPTTVIDPVGRLVSVTHFPPVRTDNHQKLCSTNVQSPVLCPATSSWPLAGATDVVPECPTNHESEQELKLNCVRSDLTQAVAEAENVRAVKANISILTAARDQLLSDLGNAKALGLPEEELYYAEMLRRKLHNAIQDLKGQVRVFCRMRPLNERELAMGDKYKLKILEHDCVESPLAGAFYFDAVFAPGTQEAIFDDCKDLVQSAFDGHNVTIFSYGPTGAGKTFTMYGMPGAEGLVGRMGKDIFGIIDGLQSSSSVSVEGSMAEIYNSRLIDLLNPANDAGHLRPKLRQSKEGTVEVDDLSSWQVSNAKQLQELLEHGFTQRSVAETALNTCSSRSHLICTIKLERTNKSGETLVGKLVFCDLGGSERLKKTEAVGERKKEAIEINKSLAALCDVIEAVAAKRKHVPYRNHLLTRMLQDSLGGTAKTLMFVHCSPASSCASETAMSLKFAARAGRIVNSSALPPHRNRSSSV